MARETGSTAAVAAYTRERRSAALINADAAARAYRHLHPGSVVTKGSNMRCLLVDNYDSYTFNLFQLIAETTGSTPTVLANDAPELRDPTLPAGFDYVVISPGPGRPEHERDLGHVPDLLRHATVPVLGVCLGHQVIAHLAGADVVAAPRPRHGHLSRIRHTGTGLFAGVPQDFVAVRYHSLCVADPLPAAVEPLARAEDGVVMALRHRSLPRWGVQFHPESIASEHGRLIIRNFLRLASLARPSSTVPGGVDATPSSAAGDEPATAWRLADVVVPGAADAELVFTELFGDRRHAFWLDSSRVEPGLSRFSFLGDASGPAGEILTYRVADGMVLRRDHSGVHADPGSIFDVLDTRLAQRRIPDPGLPFDFAGGYVGYFGYELKADTGGSTRHFSETPDAAWMFADRLVAIDHEQELTYVVVVHDAEHARAAQEWLDGTTRRLLELSEHPPRPPVTAPAPPEAAPEVAAPFVRGPDRYLRDIDLCKAELAAGESYEICLTNKVRIAYDGDDLTFYRRLRRCNPAPYAALLRLDDITVFSSSPERFLKIGADRTVESKPIKGTAARSSDPVVDRRRARGLASDPKTRAENLMIVDLLRNDLGRVCEIGSVTVPSYLAVESYATVHQLVSTIRGRLRDDVSAVECVRRCFPGGSMTGAPKLRTMQILDELETEARGIYSGALGFLSTTGAADLNIVIRTAVRFRGELTIGAGGAIVLDSVPADELAETAVKAEPLLRALDHARGEEKGAVDADRR